MKAEESSLNGSANAFRLMRKGSDVVAEFGNVGRAEGPQVPARIVIDTRLEFSLVAAKRLLVWLEAALTPHHAALRSEEAKRLSPVAAAAALAPRGGAIDVGYCAADAANFFDMVDDLGGSPYHERSFRMIDGSIQADRFLLTLDIDEIVGEPLSRVRQICKAASMPARLGGRLERSFSTARSIHFGFEGHADGPVYKIYLERGIDRAERQSVVRAGGGLLLHEAYKWSKATSPSVTARYRLFPDLTRAAIEQRVSNIAGDNRAVGVEFVRAMLDVALRKAVCAQIQYLEVEEEGTPRRSFDINFYDAHLLVGDVVPVLRRMASEVGVPRGQFQVLLDEIKNYPLGHLAGGIHRNGRIFFSIYYGVPAVRRSMREGR